MASPCRCPPANTISCSPLSNGRSACSAASNCSISRAAAPPLALTGSKDEGHELVAAYKWHNTRLTAVYERLSYENDDTTATAVTEWERDGWYVSATQQFGAQLNHKVWLAGGMNEDGSCEANGVACSTDGLGVTQLSVGYVYSLSKRTDLYASAYRIENDDSATYAGFPPVGKVAPGADTTGAGIGLLGLARLRRNKA